MVFETLIPYFAGFILITVTASMCDANISTKTAQFTQRKVVATSYKTIQPVSEIQCVRKCFEEEENGMCRVAGYSRDTAACQLGADSQQGVLDVADEMTGLYFMNHGVYNTDLHYGLFDIDHFTKM